MWLRYVRHYKKVDAIEIREKLLHCLDTALQKVVYRALCNNVDTITQTNLLAVIEMFVVDEVQEAVYDTIGSEIDTEHDVVVVDEEHAVMVV